MPVNRHLIYLIMSIDATALWLETQPEFTALHSILFSFSLQLFFTSFPAQDLLLFASSRLQV